MYLQRQYLISSLVVIGVLTSVVAWGSDKVLLSDISTLTLHHGKMTAGRRSSSVPQIKCLGGSAGCSAFVPQVIQCYNRGSDGMDVQWECKTDMDNDFRFGTVQVTCEGYDYPEDPYVLKGSCGMEYTLDLTKQGMHGKSGHSYYHSDDRSDYHHQGRRSKTDGAFGNIILVLIVLLIIYAIYRTCLRQHQYSPGNDDYNSPDGRYGTGYSSGSMPPPPGFRQDYSSDAGCGASTSGFRSNPASGMGNFWTGTMAGGVLGYMFGSNRNRYAEDTSSRYRGSTYSTSPGSGFSSSSTGGTRTASGFGGTSRR